MGLFGKNKADKQELAKKQLNEQNMEVKIDKDHAIIKPKMSGYATIWRQEDGLIYCDTSPSALYEVLDLELSIGKTEQVQVTEGTTQEKSKRTGRIAGAAIGGLAFGPAGAVIGAATGTGNKKAQGTVTEVTKTVDIPLPDYAIVKLKRYPDGPESQITVREGVERLKRFAKFLGKPYTEPAETDEAANALDPYDEIKKLVELKDMGIISEDEFETKRKQLLDL